MNISTQILSDVSVWDKYARHYPEHQRREVYDEVIERYSSMMKKRYPHVTSLIDQAIKLVKEHRVLPSMRGLQFAGLAIEKNESRVYNCAYLPTEDLSAFNETMFLLLGGTGLGYSVQQRHINKLPPIKIPLSEQKFIIEDSIEGWADAVKYLMKSYFGFRKTKPRFDFSAIRDKGARLVTAGGKAPGPEPLKKCLQLIEEILLRYETGDRIDSLACHDIKCHIADAVLSGGIRRAAMISLFSLGDTRMIDSKSSSVPSKILKKEHPSYTDSTGLHYDSDVWDLDIEQDGVIYTDVRIYRDKKTKEFWDLVQYEDTGTLGWWVCNPQRGRANNSIVLLREAVSKTQWNGIWNKIEDSRSGEPGVYWTNDLDWGTNPCCEIALKPYQFCNLSEINGSVVTDQKSLEKSVEAATILGTLQAGITDFHYLRPEWKKTTEEDALIGVGITGIASGNIMGLDLVKAANLAKSVNKVVAEHLGINPASRVTTVKPSGTTSCVLGTSSGIHPWYSEYYIRRFQLHGNEALVPYFLSNFPDLIKPYLATEGAYVLEFPIKAPEGAITREQETAIQFLGRVHRMNTEWVKGGHVSGVNRNNVSCTVSVRDDEWETVGQWMWDHRNDYNGISVLPYDGGTYKQAPFEEISKELYEEMIQKIKEVDLKDVLELDDNTQLTQEVACAGGSCEV